jgi:hypothetical protein
MRIAVVLLGLLSAWSGVIAEPVLNFAKYSADLGSVTVLGKVDVDGLGEVQLTAKRNNSQVVIQAEGPGKEILGRAETTVGLAETPVYIRTPTGLSKLTVYWGVADK